MKNNSFHAFSKKYEAEIEKLIELGTTRAEACFIVNSRYSVFSRNDIIELILERQQKEASHVVFVALIVFVLFAILPLELYRIIF